MATARQALPFDDGGSMLKGLQVRARPSASML